MKIHLDDIPDEGLALNGQLNEDLLKPDQRDEEFTGPIEYDLQIYLTEDEEVIVSGSLSVPVRMNCARCSEAFEAEHKVEDIQMILDRPAADEVELDEPIREELLISLPSYPHCDVEGSRECPGWGLIAENNLKNKETGEDGAASRSDKRWDALDDLKF